MQISLSNTELLFTSQFLEPGGWFLDQQFLDQMGASFLLAHGLGSPVKDASTLMDIQEGGTFRIYVRTRNWTRYWTDSTDTGIFKVKINENFIDTVFGNGDYDWHWQDGGMIMLKAGKNKISLHDLTGFDARCAAILFCRAGDNPDLIYQPFHLLKSLSQIQNKVQITHGRFDFVVCGAGMAGMCAAISAARLGLKVALVHDRFILGGNNSSEIRVGLGGRINIGDYPSIGYLLNEFAPERKGNARSSDVYEDKKKMEIIQLEKNITLFLGRRIIEVIKKDKNKIDSVIAIDVKDYTKLKIEGKLFADCTGDANLGMLAGASWRMGREAAQEFNEPSAPTLADTQTLGASMQWYSIDDDHPETFPDIKWGLKIDEKTVQKVKRGQWYWEVGMRDDQISDAEYIRDYGMYVAYSNWSYLKNHFSGREEYINSKLKWVSHVIGKRESRRLIGPLVLREQDIKEHILYDDSTISTSWYIDIHYPDPENSKHFPNQEFLSIGKLDPISFYPIPYRCFYSKDIKNMFMAGRNISVTHIALGTVRVMRTTAMMGEVIGMAASVCKNRKALPDDVYTTYLEDLKMLMKKGTGRTDVPYNQIYTLLDTTADRHEDC